MIPQNTILRIARPTDNLRKFKRCIPKDWDLKSWLPSKITIHSAVLFLDMKNTCIILNLLTMPAQKQAKRLQWIICLFFTWPDKEEWNSACKSMIDAGFMEVQSYNPYWDTAGVTYEDLDGYRVVLQNREWPL